MKKYNCIKCLNNNANNANNKFNIKLCRTKIKKATPIHGNNG